MTWKHWLAVLAPYLLTGAGAVATQMTHSGSAWAVLAGGVVLSGIAHHNLFTAPPVKS